MYTRLLYLVFVFIFSTLSVHAQFAVLGGVNLQNFNGKQSDDSKLENSLVIGYHAGINVQLPIASQFYFQPGLMFSTKGAKNTTGELTTTYNLYYLELPLNFVYKAPLGSGYFLLGFGPYVGYGIGGKATTEGGALTLKTDVEYQNVVEITDPLLVSYFKPLDAGGNIFFGYETAMGVFLQVNAQLGMININPEDKRIVSDKSAVKNTGFGLSAGYRF
jgi:hypothetical protein